MNNVVNVVIVAGCRTAIGTINGQFKDLTALDLSIPVMQSLVSRAGIDPVILDDVIWGCNYQRTYLENNLARVALVKAGLPETVPGITIHRNCTSSMSSIQMAYYQIKAGEAVCIMAGGADSMTNAPHMVFGVRGGKKYGNLELRDAMWDSLTNLGVGPAMGVTAENVAEKYNITRKDMDLYALSSQERAAKAIANNRFKEEIIPILVKSRKGEEIIDTDEYPRQTSLEKLSSLKATFKENGSVTAGNASGMNDAASGVIVMDEASARESGCQVLCRIVSVGTTGVAPELMGIGPISSSRAALEKAGLCIEDMDLIEVNEAFAAQTLVCQRELGIDSDKLNVNGGGISLGHPVGATGSRIVITLMNELIKRNGRYGLATLCAGGGMGTSVIIENMQL